VKRPPRPSIRWPGPRPRSVPIPPGPDPLVNTPLLGLAPGADGRERFWISSFNGAFGALGLLMDECGRCRRYPVGTFRHPGFYSAVQTGPDELWLCGNLATMVRLDLVCGRYEYFPTGAPSALMFAGMAFDAPTGKLCAIAFPPPRTVAVVFDIRRRKTVRLADLPTLDHCQRTHFSNGDGTWTLELQCPGLTLVRWDPAKDTFELHPICAQLDVHGEGALYYRLLQDERFRVYLPRLGWWNPRRAQKEDGPRPVRDDATWMARQGEWAIGAFGNGELRRWNLRTGEERTIGTWPGLNFLNTVLTTKGWLVGVTRDGDFYRIGVESGALACARRLPTESVQSVDCVIRVDRHRVVGTPFITQRFWEADWKRQEGWDCGPAAPGGGEILKVWRLGGRIYMAAYTGGELMEYDPERLPRFPENPRVVARHPAAMRPVAAADDGRRLLWYACSHPYGHLGSIVIRYDTRTGEARYHDNPLPEQQIRSLVFDRSRNALWCGTTVHADCQSVPPTADRTALALLDADTLDVRHRWAGPEGAWETQVAGPMGADRWLGVCWGTPGDSGAIRWFLFEGAKAEMPRPDALRSIPEWTGEIQYAGRPGRFVIRCGSRIELWTMRKPARIRLLADSPHLVRFFVQGTDLLCWSAWDVFVLEGVLA